MSTKFPLISVVVPAYNEESVIQKCLNSLIAQKFDKRKYEIIVVDNASTDATGKIIKQYPVKYVYEKNRSVVMARQKGFDKSCGTIIASADADTVYPDDWLTSIYKAFQESDNIVCIVGWIYHTSNLSLVRRATYLTQTINLIINRITGKAFLAFAANLAFKRQALETIGGYPKHLPQMGDQQYIVGRFGKIGKVIVSHNIFCHTDSRRYFKSNMFYEFVKYDIWHNLLAYNVNKITNKQVFGPAPAVRITKSGKIHQKP